MRVFLFSLLLSVSVSVQAEEQIVGGTVARIEDFPYHVSLQSSSHQCGGSILDHKHILTVAHCVDGRSPSRMKFKARSTQHASGGKLFEVANVTQHPDHDAKTIENDIAVLLLKESLVFGPSISPVELPSSDEDTPEAGTNCSVTGWGSTSHGGSPPANILVTYVDIIEHERCVKEYSAGSHHVDDSMICAGVLAGGKDACQGDSGGPLVDQNSRKQVGIVSWGFECGRHAHHGVYTSTASYLAWIQEAIPLQDP
jgi:trypsin